MKVNKTIKCMHVLVSFKVLVYSKPTQRGHSSLHTSIQVVIMNKYITEYLTNQFIAGMSAGQHRGTSRAEFTLQTPVALMPL